MFRVYGFRVPEVPNPKPLNPKPGFRSSTSPPSGACACPALAVVRAMAGIGLAWSSGLCVRCGVGFRDSRIPLCFNTLYYIIAYYILNILYHYIILYHSIISILSVKHASGFGVEAELMAKVRFGGFGQRATLAWRLVFPVGFYTRPLS